MKQLYTQKQMSRIYVSLRKTNIFVSSEKLRKYVYYCYSRNCPKGSIDENGKKVVEHKIINWNVSHCFGLINEYKANFNKVYMTDKAHKHAHYLLYSAVAPEYREVLSRNCKKKITFTGEKDENENHYWEEDLTREEYKVNNDIIKKIDLFCSGFVGKNTPNYAVQLQELSIIKRVLEETKAFENREQMNRYIEYCYLNGEKVLFKKDKVRGTGGKRKQIHHVIPRCMGKNDYFKKYIQKNYAHVFMNENEHKHAHWLLYQALNDEYKKIINYSGVKDERD